VYARTLLDRPLATPLPVVLFVARSDGRSFASGRERRPTLAVGGGGGGDVCPCAASGGGGLRAFSSYYSRRAINVGREGSVPRPERRGEIE
jgi:hypothetical protein